MDKLVNRVTVVQGSGPTREAKTVYDGREDDFPTIPIDAIVRSVTVVEGSDRRATVIFKSRYWDDRAETWEAGERGFRRFLKADMIRAKDAYRRHRESASGDKQNWWLDLPANMVRAFIEANREVGKPKRAKHPDHAGDRHATAEMREGKDDVKATAVDMTTAIKSKASDTTTKVKGI